MAGLVAGVVGGLVVPLWMDWRGQQRDALDRSLEGFLADNAIPGGVVAVGRVGETPEVRAYGLADPSTGRTMTPDTPLKIASLSKPITAAAVLALVEAGRVTLETRLGALFPETYESPDPRLAEVTIADLLRHSGGWDRAADLDPFFLTADELSEQLGLKANAVEDCRPVAEAMAGRALQFEPGSGHAYSNLGYCWLGLVLENVTGQPYADAIWSLLPEAVGMRLQEMPDDATPQRTAGTESYLLQRPQVLGAAGGWIATAAQVYRFAERVPHPRATERPTYADPESADHYGFGWRVWSGPRDGLLTHYGAMPGSFAVLARHDDGRIAIALFNARPTDDWTAFEEVLQIVAF
ncbi:MAG: serine hydrolase domain-containing protein [Kiloniellales bacterium]